jgi:hypothetical protein
MADAVRDGDEEETCYLCDEPTTQYDPDGAPTCDQHADPTRAGEPRRPTTRGEAEHRRHMAAGNRSRCD